MTVDVSQPSPAVGGAGASDAGAVLEVRGLRVSHGPVEAVKGIGLTVAPGEIVCLIGANGAGKTTTLRAISGLDRPSAGEIRYEGRPIDRLPPHEIVRAGLVHVPEGRRVFPRLTVRENLDLGAFTRSDGDRAGDLERFLDRFPVLRERADQAAGTLSGGEQQMLVMGRALMARPRLLLLDEPSMGLAPLVARRIFDLVAEINAAGTAVLLVEQNATQALRLAGRGYVLETGRVVLADTAAALAADDGVRRAYLGEP